MLRLIPSRSHLLTIAVAASLGCGLNSCSKDKDKNNGDPLGLKDPKSISPGFVNTAKTRQEASDQMSKSVTLSSKATAGAHSLNLMPTESKSLSLLQLSSAFPTSKISMAVPGLRSISAESEDSSEDDESSTMSVLSDVLSLSEGDDCSKLNAKFLKSYEWESSIVKAAIEIFSSEEKSDVKFGAGDNNFVSKYEKDNVRIGIGANESLKQSVIGLTSAKDFFFQQVTLLDEGSKTLTTKASGSGKSSGSTTVRKLEMTMESIASGAPKLRYQESMDIISDNQSYVIDGEMTLEKTGERQFDVNAIRTAQDNKSVKGSKKCPQESPGVMTVNVKS